uniref:Glycoside hydrolase family 19 catalytic domain-containing protein n=1 Tax=Physcomitrium patens TaxID=3218 RepID=A0A2K1KPT0_PHYPA|nr:hypothetical protein PHYPA_006658 [Physcomitrium patens]
MKWSYGDCAITNSSCLKRISKTAVWYWMKPAMTRPFPHKIMIGKWVPTLIVFRKPGFNKTMLTILTCSHESPTKP